MVVKDGRIAAVGKGALPTKYQGLAIGDFTGKSLLPGTIDCHVHLRSDGVADTRAPTGADSACLLSSTAHD